MAENLMDYLRWRGDLPFSETAPWNEVDALIMAMLCYNPLSDERAASRQGITLKEMAPVLDLMERTGNVYFRQWRQVLYTCAQTRRFGDIVIHDYVDVIDDERAMQFAVLTADLPDGSSCVAYRGTDNSITGWREDFDMSYESPVPSQGEAVQYLDRIAACSTRPLHVCGHSKGGNLAAYAASFAGEAAQARLTDIYSFDGPGLDDAALENPGYLRIKHLLKSVIPQSSVVGLLLGYHNDYTVIHAQHVGIFQHDGLTWQVDGPRFKREEDIDLSSAAICEGLHNWLKGISLEERHAFVDALHGMIQSAHVKTTEQLIDTKGLTSMFSVYVHMEKEQRRLIHELLMRALGETAEAGVKHVVGWLEAKADELLHPADAKLQE